MPSFCHTFSVGLLGLYKCIFLLTENILKQSFKMQPQNVYRSMETSNMTLQSVSYMPNSCWLAGIVSKLFSLRMDGRKESSHQLLRRDSSRSKCIATGREKENT